MAFNCKISDRDITYGPTSVSEDLDPIVVFTISGKLIKLGYRRVSNAYCRIARIDRPDWLTVMAASRHCSVANFYNADGSGVNRGHMDSYIRQFSKDILTVHPHVLRKIPTY